MADQPTWQERYDAEEERREVMDRCRLVAQRTYQEHSILSHERVARDLAAFLARRVADESVLTIVEYEARIASYLSCGQHAIEHALALLLRLAFAFEGDPDYRDEWRPHFPEGTEP